MAFADEYEQTRVQPRHRRANGRWSDDKAHQSTDKHLPELQLTYASRALIARIVPIALNYNATVMALRTRKQTGLPHQNLLDNRCAARLR